MHLPQSRKPTDWGDGRLCPVGRQTLVRATRNIRTRRHRVTTPHSRRNLQLRSTSIHMGSRPARTTPPTPRVAHAKHTLRLHHTTQSRRIRTRHTVTPLHHILLRPLPGRHRLPQPPTHHTQPPDGKLHPRHLQPR